MAVDFLAAMPALTEPTLAFFVGSSISNIVLGAGETLQDGVARTLTWFGNALPPGSKLLLSYDRCHDATRLARAYDHPALNAMEREHHRPHEPGAWSYGPDSAMMCAWSMPGIPSAIGGRRSWSYSARWISGSPASRATSPAVSGSGREAATDSRRDHDGCGGAKPLAAGMAC